MPRRPGPETRGKLTDDLEFENIARSVKQLTDKRTIPL
jgi:hypothetical protein